VENVRSKLTLQGLEAGLDIELVVRSMGYSLLENLPDQAQKMMESQKIVAQMLRLIQVQT
jgi:hypothetical protein